jgi:hypothetical protein
VSKSFLAPDAERRVANLAVPHEEPAGQSAMIGDGSLPSRKYDAGEGVAARVQS